MNNKEFDRSVAFTFYAEWAQDAETIQEDYGYEGKAKFYDAIINYALFEIEPEMKPPIKYFWNSIKEKIDASQSHRARGFSKENVEQTEAILQYIKENPSASERTIAKAVGCSNGKVHKVKQKYLSTDPNTSTNTTTSSSTSTTVSVSVSTHDTQEESAKEERDFKDLEEEEVQEIISKIHNKVPYIEVQQAHKLKYGSVTKDFENQWKQELQRRQDVEEAKMLSEYESLVGYFGAKDANEVKHIVRVLKTDVCTLKAFAQNHSEYSHQYYIDNDCTGGHHLEFGAYGKPVPRIPYYKYFSDGFKSDNTQNI